MEEHTSLPSSQSHRISNTAPMHKIRSNPRASLQLYIIALPLKKNIFQDIAQGQNTDQTIVFVNDNKPVNSRFSDCIEDGV